MSRYKLWLAAGALIVMFGLVVIYIQNYRPNNGQAEVVEEDNEWVTLNSEVVGIELRHPTDIEVIERENGVGLIKIGPTQEQGTEFYDGMSLNFTPMDTQGRSLEEYVESRQTGFEEESAVEEASQVVPVKVAAYDGYQFKISGIGEYTFTYLPKNDNEVIEIVNATVDPTGLGFSKTAEEILRTLEIK